MRAQEGQGKTHKVGHGADTAGHNGVEALVGCHATGQFFSGAPRRAAILQAKSRGNAVHKGDFLPGAIKHRDVKVAAPDGQRDAGYTGAGSQVQHAPVCRNQVGAAEIERFDNEHIENAFGIAQAGKIEARPHLQQEGVEADQRVDLFLGQVQATTLNLLAQALPEESIGAEHAGCRASGNRP